MKLYRLVLLIFIAYFFTGCSKDQNSGQQLNPQFTLLETRKVTPFDYVAIEFSDFKDVYRKLQIFRSEMESQRIIPTGPFFLMEYPEPILGEGSVMKWAVGCPTAEGQMVKEPLISGKWQSQFALVARLKAPVELLRNAGSDWNILVNNPRVKANGTIVNRFLDNSLELRKGQAIPVETWIPVFPPASPPVTVSTTSR